MNKSGKYLLWTLLSVIGAFALGYIALNRGEQINALWIVVASVCVYLIAYRFYGLYIAKNVLALDPTRMTPAVRHNDGLDYVPTDKKVLFGHHFAAIAGAGPLVGPVLAAQMGYLPGMIWLLAGVVLAGAVQDFMVLFVSTRRDGRSLGELVKEEMGPTAGVIALVACFMIMVIILAVLAMIVVKALTHSPWGTYTVAFTIPLAIFMGIYLRYLRPGRIGEVSVIGLVFLVFAIISGGWVAESPTWAPYFDFTGVQLTWMLVGYGFVAAVLPVWLGLGPRGPHPPARRPLRRHRDEAHLRLRVPVRLGRLRLLPGSARPHRPLRRRLRGGAGAPPWAGSPGRHQSGAPHRGTALRPHRRRAGQAHRPAPRGLRGGAPPSGPPPRCSGRGGRWWRSAPCPCWTTRCPPTTSWPAPRPPPTWPGSTG